MPNSFRLPETEKAYDEYKKTHSASGVCWLCDKPTMQAFMHWRIVDVLFPYDTIAKTHHMLVPMRHIKGNELNEAELAELVGIKDGPLNLAYELIMESLAKRKSVPGHFHLHLIETKDV